MKPDMVGLILCGLYTAYFIVLAGRGHFASAKGAALLDQFSVLPAQILLSLWMYCLGLEEPPFAVDSRMNSIYVFYLPSLMISYLFGWAMSAIRRLLVRLDGGRLNCLDERLLDRSDKDV